MCHTRIRAGMCWYGKISAMILYIHLSQNSLIALSMLEDIHYLMLHIQLIVKSTYKIDKSEVSIVGWSNIHVWTIAAASNVCTHVHSVLHIETLHPVLTPRIPQGVGISL